MQVDAPKHPSFERGSAKAMRLTHYNGHSGRRLAAMAGRRKANSNSPTKVLLWALLGALVLRTTVLIRQRDTSNFSQIDGYASLEIGLTLLAMLALAFSPALGAALKAIRHRSVLWFVSLYAFGLLSVLWSPLPLYSGFRAAQQLIILLGVIGLVGLEHGPFQGEGKMLWFFVFCLAAEWVTVCKFYGFTLSLGAWHTNTYSASAAMILCYCAGELLTGRQQARARLWAFASVAAFAVVVGTSAASNVATLCGLACAAVLTRSWKLLVGCALMLTVAAAVGLSGEDALSILMPGKSADGMSTLSGRTMLWDQFGARFLANPVLGEGFAVSARVSELATTNTHSSLISIFMGTGCIGGLVFALWAVGFTRESFSHLLAKAPFCIGCAAAIMAGFVNSLSCAYLGESYGVTTLTFDSVLAFHAVFALSSGRPAFPRVRPQRMRQMPSRKPIPA